MTRKPLAYEAAVERAAGLCSRAEHSRAEIVRKLRQWGAAEDVAERAADWLTDNGFIDEERFARAFVHDKSRFDGWGRLKIAAGLRQHAISAAVAQTALAEEVDEAEYGVGLRAALAAKSRQMAPGADPYKKKAALFRYAASRGFEARLVAAAVAELVAGADDFDDGAFDDQIER